MIHSKWRKFKLMSHQKLTRLLFFFHTSNNAKQKNISQFVILILKRSLITSFVGVVSKPPGQVEKTQEDVIRVQIIGDRRQRQHGRAFVAFSWPSSIRSTSSSINIFNVHLHRCSLFIWPAWIPMATSDLIDASTFTVNVKIASSTTDGE